MSVRDEINRWAAEQDKAALPSEWLSAAREARMAVLAAERIS